MKTEVVELMLSVKTVRITSVPIHCHWKGAVRRASGEKGANLSGNMKRFDCAESPPHGATALGSGFCAPDRRSWLVFAFFPFS